MKLYKIKTSKSELLPLIPIVFEDDLTEGEMMLLTDDLGLFSDIALEKHYEPNLLNKLCVGSIYEDQLTENELQFLENTILRNTFWHYDNKFNIGNDVNLKYEKIIKELSILLSEYIKEKYDDKDFEEHTFFGVYDFEYLDQVIEDCEATGLPYFEIHTGEK
ncbi:hypothetical protein I6F48_00315 [Pseudoalteromonas sp. SWYJ118]|uniref:hypothetical protein n=1 Tax=Pseudoalteromonas sp. SWYJ118 TaxID=2792062 RepID=UPI0018CF6BA7|nr:hypothetical protein [Pseudoalteromonas sp. SWYJ118]MBH0074007.1 hypothetical protein [Pseudoalteromonas sp. SWYJ118]